jgi:hypothetical protein
MILNSAQPLRKLTPSISVEDGKSGRPDFCPAIRGFGQIELRNLDELPGPGPITARVRSLQAMCS